MLKCCYGISSLAVEDKKERFAHVFMIDYDNVTLNDVTEDLLHIQKEYRLSDVYLMESERGYNAISLDVMNLAVIHDIGMDICCPADKDFFVYGFKRGYYVLRMDSSKILVDILKQDNNCHMRSLAHKLFLEWFFDIYISPDKVFNDNSKIDLIQYPSSKNGYHLMDKVIPSYFDRITGFCNSLEDLRDD